MAEKLTPLYTLITKKWKTEFLELFHKLKVWEMENVGEEQFTKCFTSVANYLENPYVRHKKSMSGSADLHMPIAKIKKKKLSRQRNRSVLDESPNFYGGLGLK